MSRTDEVRIDLAPLGDAFRELGDVFRQAARQMVAGCREVVWMPDASPGLCWSDLMAQIDGELVLNTHPVDEGSV